MSAVGQCGPNSVGTRKFQPKIAVIESICPTFQ